MHTACSVSGAIVERNGQRPKLSVCPSTSGENPDFFMAVMTSPTFELPSASRDPHWTPACSADASSVQKWSSSIVVRSMRCRSLTDGACREGVNPTFGRPVVFVGRGARSAKPDSTS
ncbi:MAG TPA: hypothetical protein DER11_04040 [Janibacter terrae]|nr:hypothetical protein [Janibacter terrae]